MTFTLERTSRGVDLVVTGHRHVQRYGATEEGAFRMTPDVMHELLQAGGDDWVSLDEAAWIVAEGDFTEGSKGLALRALGEVFQAALLVPGDLGETGFEDWAGSAEEWIARAEQELEHLVWPPMGAGFWLRLTDQGRIRLVD